MELTGAVISPHLKKARVGTDVSACPSPPGFVQLELT